MKKRIFLAAVLVCCLALAGGGTLAFFTARETAYNVITSGVLDMTLVETTKDGLPYPEDPITGVVPGMEIDKVVTLKNTGGVDFYARIAVTATIDFGDGKKKPVDLSKVSMDIDTENWTEQDGFYYYNRALSAIGEDGAIDETEPLFTTVTFAKGMGNDYQSATVEILVDAQAVQSRNNTDSPLTAAGWDAN